MTIRDAILRYPDLSPVEVADIVDCDDTYVRLVRRRAALGDQYKAQRREEYLRRRDKHLAHMHAYRAKKRQVNLRGSL